MDHKIRGLTLIELIVVMAIVAILAAVGYPSFSGYILESRRSDAIIALQTNRLTIEDYYVKHGVLPNDDQIELMSTSPEGFYWLEYFVYPHEENYMLIAHALGDRSQDNDVDCSTMVLSRLAMQVHPAKCN